MGDPRGSVWRRWEPHIHAPGTALNDQFGADGWPDYLDRLEAATPTVEALGITDYLSLDTYERVVQERQSGRLPEVGLVFANVELRFAVGTPTNSAVNAHLLVCPDDPDHVRRTRELLARLKFFDGRETYSCTPQGLIDLGRAHDSSLVDDRAARFEGTNQFKVSPDELRDVLASSEWAKSNVLVGLAAASTDGSAGLQGASLASLRRQLEQMADVIFSARPGDRSFWLGQGAMPAEQVRAEYGSLKPCLHGSDAHQPDRVAQPDQERRTWIRGDLTFESLRQACIEPDARVHIGPSPPADRALAHRTIAAVEVAHAPWCEPDVLPLNSGLVGIIGARGSGKTALADLIATGAGSPEPAANPRSFISRAGRHLGQAQVKLHWADETVSTAMASGEPGADADEARVQYLSQQFVDELCSAEGGVSDRLREEIERVVYQAHPVHARTGTEDFGELLAVRSSRARAARARSREVIDEAVAQINQERERHAALAGLQGQLSDLRRRIAEDRAARAGLSVGAEQTHATRLAQLTSALSDRQQLLEGAERSKQALQALGDEVIALREVKLPAMTADLRRRHAASGLGDEGWQKFRLRFDGDVDAVIAAGLEATEARLADLTGPLADQVSAAGDGSFVDAGADLRVVGLAALRAEVGRLLELMGLDARRRAQIEALDRSIETAEVTERSLVVRIADAEGVPARIEVLRQRRVDGYGAIFDTLVDEQRQLDELYAPLAASIAGSSGAVGKLTFAVRRAVDLDGWAGVGEKLLDLRKAGPFRGQGALLGAARAHLLDAWQHGDGAQVRTAMEAFRAEYEHGLVEHAPSSPLDARAHWRWGAQVARWLDSTEHVTLEYAVQYDGVDIEQLSPGTRGIVLLMLYLSIDRTNDRPLIVDQPEENLDPKSVYDELVTRFREIRQRRQVIIVTHNANLVVNTDVDQVVVASAGAHTAGALPDITYTSGGLEDPVIRASVCGVLEGGEAAFRERARRLRVDLHR